MAARRPSSTWARRPRGRDRSSSINKSGEVVPIAIRRLDLIIGPLWPYGAPMTFDTTIRLAEIRQDELLRSARHHHPARGRRRGRRVPRPTRPTFGGA